MRHRFPSKGIRTEKRFDEKKAGRSDREAVVADAGERASAGGAPQCVAAIATNNKLIFRPQKRVGSASADEGGEIRTDKTSV